MARPSTVTALAIALTLAHVAAPLRMKFLRSLSWRNGPTSMPHGSAHRAFQSPAALSTTEDSQQRCVRHVLVVGGSGYVAQRLMRRMRQIPKYNSTTITVTTRGDPSALRGGLHSSGVEDVCVLRWTQRDTNGGPDSPGFAPCDVAEARLRIAQCTHVLVTAPPDTGGDVGGCRDGFLEACGDLLSTRAPNLQWVGYLSTTGVYGDHGGEWVNESSPTMTRSSSGLVRLAAEREWLHRTDLPVHIFRLAGIYGPGRSVLDTVRKATHQTPEKLPRDEDSQDSQPQPYVSRVHVDDIVGVLLCSMEMAPRSSGVEDRILNVADDEPTSRRDSLKLGARVLGVDASTLVDPGRQGRERAWKARNEHKRVANGRLKEKLGYVLKFPTLRSGLRSIVDEEGG